eukprot:3994265-Alexandrium_andersonii.AAC.1
MRTPAQSALESALKARAVVRLVVSLRHRPITATLRGLECIQCCFARFRAMHPRAPWPEAPEA